jgi:hypothetical protein
MKVARWRSYFWQAARSWAVSPLRFLASASAQERKVIKVIQLEIMFNYAYASEEMRKKAAVTKGSQ